jgi:hypothetical protein
MRNFNFDQEDFVMSFMIKGVFLFLSILFLSVYGHAQQVYICKIKSDADIKVWITNYKNEATLKVFVTDYKSDAKGFKGIWYFTKYQSDAAWKIFYTKYKSEADIIIFFTKYKSEAGWVKK